MGEVGLQIIIEIKSNWIVRAKRKSIYEYGNCNMITTWKNFEGEIRKVTSNCDIYWCNVGFLKCFADFSKLSEKKFVSTVKGLEPATSCVTDQDAPTAPARHRWEPGSLNWTQFMLQWSIEFLEVAEFTEFNDSSVPFRKNSQWLIALMSCLYPYIQVIV